MSSESNSVQNGVRVFKDGLGAFNSGAAQPKTRDLTGFIDDKLFSFPASQSSQFRSGNTYSADRQDPRQSHTYGGHQHSADESDPGEDEDDDDEDEDDDGDDDEDGDGEENNNNAGESVGKQIISGKNGNRKTKHLSSFGGVSREAASKDGNYQNAVAIAAEPDGDMYYSHYISGVEASGGGGGQKDAAAAGGFSGRKDVSFSCESGESLRTILSDPVTGALMVDAMILPCGHSFGAGGMQHVMRMKSCCTCSQPVSEDQAAANLSLRAAVQAFHREVKLQFYRSSKKRKERFDQDKNSYGGDLNFSDSPRGRGVQFPFVVTDRVIIKGNKRTPQRFVGREAVVTTQCLNGWYVVKTLDNAESVKLQYRSLAKVPDGPSSKPMSSSKMPPNWG